MKEFCAVEKISRQDEIFSKSSPRELCTAELAPNEFRPLSKNLTQNDFLECAGFERFFFKRVLRYFVYFEAFLFYFLSFSKNSV